ncbi:MAG: aldo/keto reductase family oxidoreductase [Phycisphaeraceae bacterium JB051]
MKTVTLGNNGPESSRLIYGCMRIAGSWDPKDYDDEQKKLAYAAIDAAVQAGYTHFDHADIYAHTLCETIFGGYLADNPGLREKIMITTKCGIRFGDPKTFDWSYDHIVNSARKSLERLKCGSIDVLLLHRPDYLVEADEVARAFETLKTEGTVKYFGLSNCNVQRVELIRQAVGDSLVCNQLELHPLRVSPWKGPWEDGTLDHLKRRNITPTAWSPLAGGRLAKRSVCDEPDSVREHVQDTLVKIGKKYDADMATMTMAWLLRHPSGILPIVGSRTPQRITAMAKADDIELSRVDWYEIYTAAYGKNLP